MPVKPGQKTLAHIEKCHFILKDQQVSKEKKNLQFFVCVTSGPQMAPASRLQVFVGAAFRMQPAGPAGVCRACHAGRSLAHRVYTAPEAQGLGPMRLVSGQPVP